MTRLLVGFGLVGVAWLAIGSFRADFSGNSSNPATVGAAFRQTERSIQLLAVGDVNLGRIVGQQILRGDTLFPFVFAADTFARRDIVFANLESQLSDQGGETQHPENNLIFTGPPGGASSLRLAGVTVVSTANNHALDYGVRALKETIRYLRGAGVAFAGTAEDSVQLYVPVIVTRNDIRVALFAVTDVMNIEDPMWKRHVAEADTGKLLPQVRAYRDSVDFIIISYHGGEEYADTPTWRTRDFAAQVIRGGADLFLGHHPHVPYGVEDVDGKFIVHSLGNFVFRQPDLYWTQRSFAFSATLTKDSAGTRIVAFRCLPVLAGGQPAFADGAEAARIQERTERLSSRTTLTQIAWQEH